MSTTRIAPHRLHRLAAVLLATSCAVSACVITTPQPSPLQSTSTSESIAPEQSTTNDGAPPTGNADDTNAGLPPLGTANVEEKIQRPEPPADLNVTNVRIGTHDTFDRIVFDFTGAGTPGWFVRYTKDPTAQGSGKPVHIAGDTFLEVNIDGVAYPFEVGEAPKIFDITDPPGTLISEIDDVSIFEGRQQFMIGLSGGEHPYSVQVLNNPTRLVIDILQQ
ncbi:hypothetical protein ACFPVT_09685 [Corynebacterium choanae]|uniref:AMIN-like domain-containing protein n=1 Tax=Corynebacterium choanae TaxID=1862358 RepID=A0A3G6J8W1_9CORY|nr:hypothetical protein [Corynebacterium choanae]AZA14232.1 hypothetical protein CCHOA_09245 [Corynebacterium choanae]